MLAISSLLAAFCGLIFGWSLTTLLAFLGTFFWIDFGVGHDVWLRRALEWSAITAVISGAGSIFFGLIAALWMLAN